MHQPNKKQSGFTLIELLLAMSFVAVLLILILTATLQVTRIYNKGITLKEVNQAGAVIGSDLQSTMKSSDAPITPGSLAAIDRGRFCLGTYSYVWNTNTLTTNKYSGADASTPIGLVKVADPTQSMCAGTQPVQKSSATELILGSGQTGVHLQVRDFAVTRSAESGIDYVYTVAFTLATADDATDPLIAATGTGPDACKGGPGDEFCALNSFSFDVFMRQGGSGRSQ